MNPEQRIVKNMPRVRLTGLFLFITVLCLALATAVTQTSHIRFKRSDTVVAAETVDGESADRLQFVSVPVVYPLAGLGVLGLLLWFVPAGFASVANNRSTNWRKSRKERSQGFFGRSKKTRR